MAFPILLNIRHVVTTEKQVQLAISNFGLNDSGMLFVCDYDQAQELPWGVTIVEVRGNEFGLFSGMSDEKKQMFSSELSSLLNGFYGMDSTNKPISIKPEQVKEKLSEQVFTFVSQKEGSVTLVPVGVSQKELFEKAPKDIPFFSDFPAGYLSPEGA